MENNKKNKVDILIEHLLYIDMKDVNLKFIFDNLRNYTLSALLLIASKFLWLTDKVDIIFSGFNKVVAFLLFVFGLMLFILNVIHPIYILVTYKKKFKLNLLTYMIYAMLVFMVGYAYWVSSLFVKLS